MRTSPKPLIGNDNCFHGDTAFEVHARGRSCKTGDYGLLHVTAKASNTEVIADWYTVAAKTARKSLACQQLSSRTEQSSLPLSHSFPSCLSPSSLFPVPFLFLPVPSLPSKHSPNLRSGPKPSLDHHPWSGWKENSTSREGSTSLGDRHASNHSLGDAADAAGGARFVRGRRDDLRNKGMREYLQFSFTGMGLAGSPQQVDRWEIRRKGTETAMGPEMAAKIQAPGNREAKDVPAAEGEGEEAIRKKGKSGPRD